MKRCDRLKVEIATDTNKECLAPDMILWSCVPNISCFETFDQLKMQVSWKFGVLSESNQVRNDLQVSVCSKPGGLAHPI